jgi:hypothetical protein
MARPSLSIRLIGAQTFQTAAGIRLESVHDHLGTNVRLHHYMNMVCSHVSRQENPTTMQAYLAQSTEYRGPALKIEAIRQLVHQLAFYGCALWIGLHQSASGHVVMPVH